MKPHTNPQGKACPVSADLAHLEELARAATPGPWNSRPTEDDMSSRCVVNDGPIAAHAGYPPLMGSWTIARDALPEDGDFIAALAPEVVLELIERAKQDREDLEWAMTFIGEPYYASDIERAARIRARLCALRP